MSQKLRRNRIVLDTSAYVAALLSESGGAAAVFERILKQDAVNFYTPEILAELHTVLLRPKFGITRDKREQFTRLIEESSYEVQALKQLEISLCRDPSDDKFLSLCHQIDADFLVSLDQDLLVLSHIGKTKIVTPGEYLALEN